MKQYLLKNTITSEFSVYNTSKSLNHYIKSSTTISFGREFFKVIQELNAVEEKVAYSNETVKEYVQRVADAARISNAARRAKKEITPLEGGFEMAG